MWKREEKEEKRIFNRGDKKALGTLSFATFFHY